MSIELLTIEEAAKWLSLTREEFMESVKASIPPTMVEVDGDVYFYQPHLHRWLARHAIPATGPALTQEEYDEARREAREERAAPAHR